MLIRVSRGRRTRRYVQFVEDVAQVARHGLFTDFRLLGDLAIRDSGRHQFQDFDFSERQWTGLIRRVMIRVRINKRQIGHSAQLSEHVSCRCQFVLRGFASSLRLIGSRQQNLCSSRFVGSLEVAKAGQRLSQFDYSGRQLLLREQHGPVRIGRQSLPKLPPSIRAAIPNNSSAAMRAVATSFAEIAISACALSASPRLPGSTTTSITCPMAVGGVHFTAGQVQQGHTGRWHTFPLGGRAIGLFRLVKLPEQTMHFGLAIKCRAHRRLRRRL